MMALVLSGCDGRAGTAVVRSARAERVAVRVVGITDGDTITVRMGGETVKVRLSGIDAPEKKQAYGAKAKAVLSELLEGREVALGIEGKDRYGRTLARVFAGGDDVGVAMVRAGMAWHFVRYDKSADLAAAQREAFAAKRGLWGEEAPVAPWEFRRSRKTANSKPQTSKKPQ